MFKKAKKMVIVVIGGILAIIVGVFFKTIFTPSIYGVPNDIEYSSMLIQNFNSKFISYVGKHPTTAVIGLINLVIENNTTNENIVGINNKIEQEELNKIMVTLEDGKLYNISVQYDDIGFVRNIVITIENEKIENN